MDFLDEFDRRAKKGDGKDEAKDLPAEDRELLEFADLVRSRLPAAGGERERVLKRVQQEHARHSAGNDHPGAKKITHLGPLSLTLALSAAAVLLFVGTFWLMPRPEPGTGVATTDESRKTEQLIKEDRPIVKPLAAITPAPRFEAKSIQDEFSGVSFPELKEHDGQGAAAVEKAGDLTNVRVTRVAGLAMYQNKNEKRWRVCTRGQSIEPGAVIRASKRANSGVRLLSPDGSALSLSPGASIRYEDARSWMLGEGIAYFDVASRKDLAPFTVATPHGKPHALGTQFSLEVTPQATLCWVDEGRVALNAEGSEVCDAGGSAILDKAGARRADTRGSRDWLRTLESLAESDHGVGQLVAAAEKANEHVPLEIKSHDVSVTVIDQVARTFVDMVFINNSDRRLEGTFYYPLPADASISEFAMYVGNQRIVGEVLEQHKARQVFEYIVRQQRDPALLEYAGGNLFKMRVFPIEPRSEKRVQLGYTQILTRSGGKVTYTYPLFSEMLIKNPLHDLKVTFNARSTSGMETLVSPTHQCASGLSEDKHSGAMSFRARNYSPSRDFTVTYDVPNAPECAAFANQRPEDENAYFMLQLCPAARGVQSELAQRLLVIVDGSASSVPQDYAIATEFAASSADLSKNWQFGLIRGGQSPEVFGGGMVEVDANTPDRVRQFLESRAPLGATDLMATFRAAAALAGDESLRIVYVGDGIDTLNEASSSALLRDISALFKGKNVTFSTVAVGSSYERPVMQGLAANLGGTFVRIEGADGIYDAAGRIFDGFYRSALRDVRVEFEGVEVNAVYPEVLGTLTAGDTAVVLGRVTKPGKGKVIVRADAGGEAFARAFDIDLSANEKQNRFLPRLWARAHIDALLAGTGLGDAKQDGDIRNAVIETSTTYQIMSPFTSFLVLESEEDYARFGIKRKLKQWDWKGDDSGVMAGQAAAKMAESSPAPIVGSRLEGNLEDFRSITPQFSVSNEETERQKQEIEEKDLPVDAIEQLKDGLARDMEGREGLYEDNKLKEIGDNFEVLERSVASKRSSREYAYASRADAPSVDWRRSNRSKHAQYAQSPRYYSLVLAAGKLVDLEVDQPLRSTLYYQRMVNAGRGSLSSQLNLSLALESEGRFAEALKALLPVLEKQPAMAELRLQEASLRFRSGDEAGGRAALDQATQLTPEKERAALKDRLPSLLMSLGRYADAAVILGERYEKVEDAASALPVLQNLTNTLYNANQREKARDLWERELKRWPDEVSLRSSAAQFFAGSLQDNTRAISILREGKTDDAYGRQQLANLLLQAGKPDEAIAEVRKLIAEAKDHNAVYSALTVFAGIDRNGTSAEALNLLRDGNAAQTAGALQYAVSYGIVWKKEDVATLLAAAGRKDVTGQARIHAFNILFNLPETVRPENAAIVAIISPVVGNVGTKEDVSVAVQAFAALAGRIHDEATLALGRGLSGVKDLEEWQRAQIAQGMFGILQALGRKEEATKVLQACFQECKNESSVYSLAWSLFYQRLNDNDMDGAIALIEQFAARFPESAYIGQFHQQIIQNIRGSMKGKEAEALMEHLLKAYPNTPAYMSLRVQLLTQQGKWRDAAESIKAAIKALEDEKPETKDQPAAPPETAPKTEEQKVEEENQKQVQARQRIEERAARRCSLIYMLARLSSQDAELRTAFLKEADEKIKTEDPGEREWTEALLACLSASGDTTAYAKRLEQLALGEPGDPVWTRLLGYAQSADKQFEKARATLAGVWAADKDDFGVALTLQTLCVKLKDEKAAQEWFSRAFDAIAKDLSRLSQYASNWQSQRPEWALLAWKRYAQTAPEGQRSYGFFQAGVLSQQLGRNTEAVENYFEALTSKDGGYASSALSHMITLAQQEEQLRAIEPRIEKALASQPNAPRAAMLHLLSFHLKKIKGDATAAQASLLAAAACKETDYSAASQVATAMVSEKSFDAAETYVLENGAWSDDQRRQLIRQLASSLSNDETLARREKLLRKLLEKPDANAEQDRSQLVQCLANQNKYVEAEKELRAMALTRDAWASRNAWDFLISRRQRAQQFDEALRLALDRLNLEDDDSSGYRGQAFGTYARICGEALRKGKLSAPHRQRLTQSMMEIAKGYFERAQGYPPWNYVGYDELVALGASGVDGLADAAGNSDDPHRVAAAAQFYESSRRRPRATKLYQRALTLKGVDQRQVYPQLYNLYVYPHTENEKPDWPNAIEALEKLHTLKCYDENTYLFERGRCLYGLNQRDDARTAYRKLLESPGYLRNGYWSAQNVASQCQQVQDWTMAAEAWEVALRLFRRQSRNRLDVSTLASFYTSCAAAYAQAGETAKATDCFLRGMSIVPRNDNSYKQLLNAAIQNVLQGRTLDQTVKEYVKQVKEPGGGEKPHLRIAFAEAYSQAGNKRQMLEHLRVAADLLPRDLDLRRQVIDGYRELKDVNSALAAYKDWARLDPQNIDIYRGMGDLYESMGKRQDALLAWATMAEVRPREAEGYRGYAQKLLAVNQPERAAVALRQAVKYRPTEFDIASELAGAYTSLKQQNKIPALWTDGEAACRKAIQDLADDPAPWLSLGSFLTVQGRKNDAHNLYVQILQRPWPRFQNETYTEAKKRLAE